MTARAFITSPPVIVAAWLAVAASGMGLLFGYDLTPGREAKTLGTWPGLRAMTLDRGKPTLVLVAHPSCSCTRASLFELRTLVSHTRGAISAHVLFVTPTDDTRLLESARSIPGVHVHEDRDGVDAARLGALTSGQTYLFARDGSLLFQGGITGSRGHVGDNVGRERIEALALGHGVARDTSAVFGCPIPEGSVATAERNP